MTKTFILKPCISFFGHATSIAKLALLIMTFKVSKKLILAWFRPIFQGSVKLVHNLSAIVNMKKLIHLFFSSTKIKSFLLFFSPWKCTFLQLLTLVPALPKVNCELKWNWGNIYPNVHTVRIESQIRYTSFNFKYFKSVYGVNFLLRTYFAAFFGHLPT